jgi:hypothetical protein
MSLPNGLEGGRRPKRMMVLIEVALFGGLFHARKERQPDRPLNQPLTAFALKTCRCKKEQIANLEQIGYDFSNHRIVSLSVCRPTESPP